MPRAVLFLIIVSVQYGVGKVLGNVDGDDEGSF